MLSPDLYLPYFDEVCARYAREGNPLFIPETRAGAAGAANALLAFGKYNAIGFSPFYIDRIAGNDAELASAYNLLAQLSPLILEHQGKGTMTAIQVTQDNSPQDVQLGDYTAHVAFASGHFGPATAQQPGGPGAAILIATGPNEFYVAGSSLSMTFTPNTPGPPLAGLATVEEGRFVDGRWTPGRLLAGDDTGQGERIQLRTDSILRVTLYRYR
jgi:hypothetical protein